MIKNASLGLTWRALSAMMDDPASHCSALIISSRGQCLKQSCQGYRCTCWTQNLSNSLYSRACKTIFHVDHGCISRFCPECFQQKALFLLFLLFFYIIPSVFSGKIVVRVPSQYKMSHWLRNQWSLATRQLFTYLPSRVRDVINVILEKHLLLYSLLIVFGAFVQVFNYRTVWWTCLLPTEAYLYGRRCKIFYRICTSWF